MAKVRSIVNLSGTINGLTFVDSKAYGAHTRAKRGTYTPITLADGMKESGAKQTIANNKASLLFNPLKTFANGFSNGKLWSTLVGKFRKQQREQRPYTFADFHLMQIREDYSTHKHGTFRLLRNTETEQVTLTIHKRFMPIEQDEGQYKISLLRIPATALLTEPYPTTVLGHFAQIGSSTTTLVFDFPALPPGADVLYCLKCEGYQNGEALATLKSMGMVLLKY